MTEYRLDNGMSLTVQEVTRAVGGPAIWKGAVKDLDDLVARLRSGLPYPVLEAICRDFGLDLKEIAPILGIPWTTLMRRRRARRFRPDESDRVYRVARIATMAAAVLEGKERAARWLREPNRALGGQVPLTMLDTDVGARQVESVLGRIEHGVYS